MHERCGSALSAAAGNFAPRETAEVLFLCSGNYYRSRHAEMYFNWLAERQAAPWRATSRGLALSDNNVGALSVHTAARLAELGIVTGAAERFPAPVRDKDFAAARHVIAVKEAEHRPMIAGGFPQRLAEVEFWEIHDLDCAPPSVALPQLERQVECLLTRVSRGLLAPAA